jgi:hypothetical protein
VDRPRRRRSGKGIPAAMALGSLRSTFRALSRQRLGPGELVTQLSQTFLQDYARALSMNVN